MKDGHNRLQHVVLVGSTSEIGLSLALQMDLQQSAQISLVGRSKPDGQFLKDKFMQVNYFHADFTQHYSIGEILENIKVMGDIDSVIIAPGMLTERRSRASDVILKNSLEVYCQASIRFLSAFTEILNKQMHGQVIVLSSIAIFRPRQSNYVYGSAKLALDFFTRGLIKELESMQSPVSIKLIRCGFVKSKMTVNLTAPPFSRTVEEVVKSIHKSLRNKNSIIYIPRISHLLALLIRILPEKLITNR
jgi:short-subunit dehydrogenase